jgi:hypothetical protein
MAIRVRAWIRPIIAAGLVIQFGVVGATLLSPETHDFTSQPADLSFTVVNDGTLQPPNPATVTNTPGPGNSQSDPKTLNFAKFDPALGTLDNVIITFMSTFSATAKLVSASNNSSDNISMTGDVFHSYDFFADGTLNIKLSGALIPDQAPLLPPTVEASCKGVPGTDGTCADGDSTHQSMSIIPPGTFDSPMTGITGLTTASFIGPGMFTLSANLTSALAPRIDPDNGTGFADNATFMGMLTSLWNGSVSVQYDYTPNAEVPEPVTLYLLLAGLGGIALSRRRRA